MPKNIEKYLNMYIHIPFCKQKCYYCDFLSLENSKRISEYIECLQKEIVSFAKEIKEKLNVKTLYIGGGTPSYIDSKYIIDVLNCIKENYYINENIEITIEINPGTINIQKLQDYFINGINRISIGLQSADNKLLKDIGRIHRFSDFLKTYGMVRDVGFKNTNVDIMLGLPNQTIEILEDTINKVIELKPKHISTYSLIIENGTRIKSLINSSEYIMPDEETERQMYWHIKNKLEENGYKHYEISNFAYPGFESKHNLDCWRQEEYVGFGLGAHSYIDGFRYSNTENIDEYIYNVNNMSEEDNITIHEKQTKRDMMKEYMILGMRVIDGVNIEEFKRKFKAKPLMLFKKELQELIKEGYLLIDGNNIKLSEKGIDFANRVWGKFI